MLLVGVYLLLLFGTGAAWTSRHPEVRTPEQAERIPLETKLLLNGVPELAALRVTALLLRRAAGPRDPGPAPPVRAAAAGALAALAFLPVLCAVALLQQAFWRAAGWEMKAQPLVEGARTGSEGQFLVVAFFAVVVAPLFEETLFRVHLYAGLRGWLAPPGAAVLTAAAFALIHGQAEVYPVTFVLGLFLADLRERTGGRSAPIAMHACYNALQMAGILVLRGAAEGAAGG
jgi:membrane protease YdiL (CAAX protease family)